MHVTSVDCESTKCHDASRRHYCAVLQANNSHRKLYFISYAQLEATIATILEPQGFIDRLSQYDFVSHLDSITSVRRSIVCHKGTGIKYELIMLPKPCREQEERFFMAQIDSLHKIKHNSLTMSCLDYFTDYKGIYVVMMYSEKLTLQDVVMKFPASGCPVKFVKKTLERMVKNVHSVH